MKGELNRTIMICVDSYKDSNPVGSFHVISNEEAIPFHSLSQLLIGISNTLDKENFPQSFSALRKFHSSSNQDNSLYGALPPRKGNAATFSVRLLFRQNASWQGVVTWIEENKEEYFRSVLELVMLLDNALAPEANS